MNENSECLYCDGKGFIYENILCNQCFHPAKLEFITRNVKGEIVEMRGWCLTHGAVSLVFRKDKEQSEK